MSGKDKASKQELLKDWHYHALVWVDETTVKTGLKGFPSRVKDAAIYISRIADTPEKTTIVDRFQVSNAHELEEALRGAAPGKRKLTVWIARGWQDLVLSGLSELIETGAISWRWMTLDGPRVMLSGKIGGKPLGITSLSCWTGGAWDAWEEAVKTSFNEQLDSGNTDLYRDGELTAILSVTLAILGRRLFACGKPALSMASQSRGMWRNWLAPSCTPERKEVHGASDKVNLNNKCIILPLPERPNEARAAERQACYGLPREQFFYGHVGNQVEVWDISGAYATALAYLNCPTAYREKKEHLTTEELTDNLKEHTAVALVEIDSGIDPYPIRIGGRVGRAVGKYWTWLAGQELDDALAFGHVKGCECAYLWTCSRIPNEAAHEFANLSAVLKEQNAHGIAAFWRSCYAALVGQFAQWKREWVDCNLDSPFGPWSSWTQTEKETGEIRKYRSIGGRVQVREDKGDSISACPMVYACITAAVRCEVDRVRRLFDPRHILAASADALWIDARANVAAKMPLTGMDSLLWRWQLKEVYEDAWIDGKGGAVVLAGGEYYPVVTGVPTHAEIGPDGRSKWMVSVPWNVDGNPSRQKGVRVNVASFNGEKLMRECEHPLQQSGPWIEFSAALLREELLKPCVT